MTSRSVPDWNPARWWFSKVWTKFKTALALMSKRPDSCLVMGRLIEAALVSAVGGEKDAAADAMGVAAGAAANGTAHEHFKTVHRSSGCDIAPDDGRFAGRCCRLYAASGFSITPGGLSHDPGGDFLSGRQSGGHGFFSNRAA